jgi:phosphoserine aminotransferase
MNRVMNFNAGPAALPLAALERAQRELVDFANTGMSVMEHSHRGAAYEAVHNEAIGLLRELVGIPSDYDVMFVQGGASQQFAVVPMNFLTRATSADYVVAGAWGEKAVEEARVVAASIGANARVAASAGEGEGKDKRYVRAPLDFELGEHTSYVHVTSNETIHGIQYGLTPETAIPDVGEVPLVCDMSSDFLWKPLDVKRFSLVYAGAQKNLGPSGVTVVLAKKSFVASGRKDIPKILQYRTHAEHNSLYNTPPTFGVYLVRNVLAWIKESGGLKAMESRNREKATTLYATLDRHRDFYRCPVDPAFRSVMNVVFRLPNEALEKELVAEAERAKMVGIKGHRSVGGIRVSLYNAVEPAWVRALCSLLEDFAKRKG